MAKDVKPLAGVVGIAEQELSALEEALGRPEVSFDHRARLSLELLLRALAMEAQSTGEPSFVDFATRVSTFLAAAEDVHLHLEGLVSDWTCPHCASDVARDVRVSGVRAGKIQAALICQACEEESPLARAGLLRLFALFGARFESAWNPRANGFVWDDT